MNKIIYELSIKSGHKLSYDCFSAFNSPVYLSHYNSTFEIGDELGVDKSDINVDLESLKLAKLEVSPLIDKKVIRGIYIIEYGKRKIKQIQLSVNEDIPYLLGYDSYEGILSPSE